MCIDFEFLGDEEIDYELEIRGIRGILSRSDKQKALREVFSWSGDPENSVQVIDFDPVCEE